ncbi:MAG TPA: M24 family metallopeptidase, partial [Burkholderiales bacterium]|nr:M24 family metallopeptidase [Burkholderiales bacterium]
FPREGDPTLLIYVAGHLANAREISVIEDVRAGTDLAGMIRDRVREVHCERGRIGIVGNFAWSNSSIPLEHYQSLKANLPDATIDIVTRWYEEHRLAKSAEEVEFMAHGAAICDHAFDAFRALAAPGVTEVALHNEALRVVHAHGGRIAFGHVGSTAMRDPKMTYPSFYPTHRALQRGDVIMTELTGGYGGYFGKLYTTSFVGAPTPEYETMFELAAQSYRELIAAVRPGVRGKDLTAAMAGKAAATGFKSLSFISGWSTYNTRPVLFSRRVEADDLAFELKPGYGLNVAGWVVDQDERMGVWIGDTVMVTENGVRRLHRSPIDELAANILT